MDQSRSAASSSSAARRQLVALVAGLGALVLRAGTLSVERASLVVACSSSRSPLALGR
jgi:hypothetical protein